MAVDSRFLYAVQPDLTADFGQFLEIIEPKYQLSDHSRQEWRVLLVPVSVHLVNEGVDYADYMRADHDGRFSKDLPAVSLQGGGSRLVNDGRRRLGYNVFVRVLLGAYSLSLITVKEEAKPTESDL